MAKSPALPTLQGKRSSLPSALRGLINNPQFSDVSFVVGKERQVVHAHRCILACRCPVFQRMFSHQLQTAQELQVPFVLADYPCGFLAVIEFIYTNGVTLTGDIVDLGWMELGGVGLDEIGLDTVMGTLDGPKGPLEM
ncbi:LOW QUALITY PROTEIN: BTB/POZ domain-containing protein 19 [Mantella aurantiaca]